MALHLDCSCGVSGDMLVGALVDLGADFNLIHGILSPLAEVKLRKVSKRGVSAKKFEVFFQPKSREYVDLVKEIGKLRIPVKAKILSMNILRTLAEAESRVHKVPLNKVHLHDAVDCVVDSISIALALSDLGLLDSEGGITSSIVSIGGLAPASFQIVKKYRIPVRISSENEIATPTGLAALANIVSEYVDCGGKKLAAVKTGVGAGTRDFNYPNVLKASIFRTLVLLESNIDDCTSENLSYAVERLMDEGALDVHVIQCVMKKGRLGYLVRVLTDDSDSEKFSKILMMESGTLGVRVLPIIHRFEAEREIRTVKLGKENARVKVSEYGIKPEYDDVRRIARKCNIRFSEASEKILGKSHPR